MKYLWSLIFLGMVMACKNVVSIHIGEDIFENETPPLGPPLVDGGKLAMVVHSLSENRSQKVNELVKRLKSR